MSSDRKLGAGKVALAPIGMDHLVCDHLEVAPLGTVPVLPAGVIAI